MAWQKHTPAIAGISMALLIARVASAQDADPAAPEVKRMDTVIVTGVHEGLGLEDSASSGALGQRKVLDTPFSVTVIGNEDILRRQATSVAQIFINDPSVSSSSTSGTTTALWPIPASRLATACSCGSRSRTSRRPSSTFVRRALRSSAT